VRGEETHLMRGDPVAQKGVNLEKQSTILRFQCRAYGMNGSGCLSITAHSGIQGDLPGIFSLTKHGGLCLADIVFPLISWDQN